MISVSLLKTITFILLTWYDTWVCLLLTVVHFCLIYSFSCSLCLPLLSSQYIPLSEWAAYWFLVLNLCGSLWRAHPFAPTNTNRRRSWLGAALNISSSSSSSSLAQSPTHFSHSCSIAHRHISSRLVHLKAALADASISFPLLSVYYLSNIKKN